jgi:hypothetical protein
MDGWMPAPRCEYWLPRVKWSICGVLIPEIVVLLAWRQWTSAGWLTNEVNKVLNDIEHRSTSNSICTGQR